MSGWQSPALAARLILLQRLLFKRFFLTFCLDVTVPCKAALYFLSIGSSTSLAAVVRAAKHDPTDMRRSLIPLQKLSAVGGV